MAFQEGRHLDQPVANARGALRRLRRDIIKASKTS
jgi:hypothetical protein